LAAASFGPHKPNEPLVTGEGPDAAELRAGLKGRKPSELGQGEVDRWLRLGLIHYLSADGFQYVFPALLRAALEEKSGESLASLVYILAEGSGDQFATFTAEQFRVIDALLDYALSQRKEQLSAFSALGNVEKAHVRWSSAT
jgi:hypothetical protein